MCLTMPLICLAWGYYEGLRLDRVLARQTALEYPKDLKEGASRVTPQKNDPQALIDAIETVQGNVNSSKNFKGSLWKLEENEKLYSQPFDELFKTCVFDPRDIEDFPMNPYGGLLRWHSAHADYSYKIRPRLHFNEEVPLGGIGLERRHLLDALLDSAAFNLNENMPMVAWRRLHTALWFSKYYSMDIYVKEQNDAKHLGLNFRVKTCEMINNCVRLMQSRSPSFEQLRVMIGLLHPSDQELISSRLQYNCAERYYLVLDETYRSSLVFMRLKSFLLRPYALQSDRLMHENQLFFQDAYTKTRIPEECPRFNLFLEQHHFASAYRKRDLEFLPQFLSQIAYIRATAIHLACQEYHRDHKKYPDQLSELVPGYILSLPEDPTNPGSYQFSYQSGEEPVISFNLSKPVNPNADGISYAGDEFQTRIKLIIKASELDAGD